MRDSEGKRRKALGVSRRYSRREFVRRTSLAGLGLSAGAWLSDAARAEEDPADPLWRSFLKPPDDARIMFRWWWFGPAVTPEELEREMRAMKAAGVGGFEVQPVYALSLDNPDEGIRNLPYLSDGFLDALQFVAKKAQQLGLRFDLTGTTGWPYGGARVPVIQAAGMLRVARVRIAAGDDSVPTPALEAGESLIAAWAVRDEANFASGVHELTGFHGPRVSVAGSPDAHVVLFFVSSRTGQLVKRAAVGNEGFVVDHYDRASVEAYLDSTVGPMLRALGSEAPYALFSDSLEVFASDWTPNLLTEFERRRGYDLKPHLLALVGDTGPQSAAVRCDWGHTLTELVNENYLTTVQQWAERHHTRFRAQVYGTPPVTLSSNRRVDLPEGEAPNWRGLSPVRWASSACHLYGRPITSSETWTWVHSPVFRATPLDLKALADLYFLEGSNQIVGHGWPYSSPAAGEPGWAFYAAGALNDHNPWWMVMPDLTLYLQRVSFILRQGIPVSDVAVYLSNSDAWEQFRAGRSPSVNEALAFLLGPTVLGSILDAGFNFDFMDDEAISRVGIPYRAVVLPNVERIPLAAYQKLRDFAQHGGLLVATGRRPALAPGLLEGERDNAQVQVLTRELFESPTGVGAFLNDASDVGSALAGKLVPDIEVAPKTPLIGFVHRQLGSKEIYFVVNTSNTPQSVQITFRAKNLSPERWDLFSGAKQALEPSAVRDGRVTVPFHLAPYESVMVVFAPSPAIRAAKRVSAASVPEPLDVSAGWTVTFPELGKTIPMNRLRSWTEYKSLRFFSGQATYEKTINLPASFGRGTRKIILRFGEGTPVKASRHGTRGLRAWLEGPVREAAVVYLNDRRAGSVWHPPYELDLTPWLRSGRNTFRIVVANLAINRMAGESLPASRLLNSLYRRRFRPQDLGSIKPLPSGLLGPLSLIVR